MLLRETNKDSNTEEKGPNKQMRWWRSRGNK